MANSTLPQHAPEGYVCPFCQIVAGSTAPLTQPSDVIYRDRLVTAFVASHWFDNNPAHVLVIPNAHSENIYDLPLRQATRIHRVAREVALALKAIYGCDGISTRQHNEPDGYQEVWHYHLHVFPRYHGDDLYLSYRSNRPTTAAERQPYAEQLKAYLQGAKEDAVDHR